MADVWVNSMACHPTATCHIAGGATWRINVMTPEPHITLQGPATWRIQQHVIPEPRITLRGAATW